MPTRFIDLDGLEELDPMTQFAEENGLTIVKIVDDGIDGVGNVIATAVELAVTDNFEGRAIRKVLEKKGLELSNEITNEHLGSIFQLRKIDRELVVQEDPGFLKGTLDFGLSVLASTSILAPKGPTGLLAKAPTANLAAWMQRALDKGLPRHIIDGILFEDSYYKQAIEEGRTLQRRVTFTAKDGDKTIKAVVDFVETLDDGSFKLIETKLRHSTDLTKNQEFVYKAIENGTAKPVGNNAKAVFGTETKTFKGEVIRKNKINKDDNE